MKIEWYHKCYMCSAPLDFMVNIPGEHLEAFYTYSNYKPITFIRNISYKKIIGLQQRRLCLRCFLHKKMKVMPGPRDLMKRETSGTSGFLTSTRPPLSQQDAYTWFSDFNDFLHRKDLQDCLLKNANFSISGLAVIVWTQHAQDLLDVLTL